VFDATIGEVFLVVFLLVESDNSLDAELLEYINIFCWVVSVPLLCISFFDWSHEGTELSWNDPVDITVLYLFVLLVDLDLEGPEVIPSKLDCILKSLEYLQ
jgi:hypothetical protein